MSKKASRVVDATTGLPLQGVRARRPRGMRRLKKRFRRVSRAYGGSVSHTELKDR